MKDKCRIIDELHVTIRDKYGNIKKDYTVNKGIFYKILHKLGLRYNSIVHDGMAQMALLAINASATPFTYMDIGTNTTAANNAQTALLTSLLTNRAAATVSRVTTDGQAPNDTSQWVHTFSKANDSELTGTNTVTETGVFTAISSGTMLLRIVWAGDSCNWDAGDTLQLTVKCQMKQGS